MEPQPKFDEIERRFENELARLRDIEDVNLFAPPTRKGKR